MDKKQIDRDVSENNPQHFETTSNFVAQLVILRSESDNSILNLK